MNPSAIYSKSGKGVQEASGKTSLLKRGDRAVLSAIDGRATLGEVAQKVGKSFDAEFEKLIHQLDKDGFVREVGGGQARPAAAPAKAPAPAPKAPAAKAPAESSGGPDLDFTTIMPAIKPGARPAPPPAKPAPSSSGPPSDLGAQQRAKAQETSLYKAREEAEAKSQADRDRVRLEMEGKARAEAEAKIRAETEKKVREEAEAKVKAEAEAKAKAARDTAMRLAAEARAKAEAQAQTRIEAERKARDEVERKAREEADKARREAEELRQRLEEERKAREAEERRRKEDEERRRKDEEERRAREEAERKARDEAERQRREEEDRSRREDDERRRKEDEERRMREEIEAKARAAAEAARREEEERRVREKEEHAQRAEAEAQLRKAREEHEARAKAREEEEARASKSLDETRARLPTLEVPPPAAPPKREPEPAKASGGSLDALMADLDSFSQREEQERETREAAERETREAKKRKSKEDSERRRSEEAARKQREEEERHRHDQEQRRAQEEAERRVREAEEQRERLEEERRRKTREAAAAAAAKAEASTPKAADAPAAPLPNLGDIGVTDDDLGMDDVRKDEAAVARDARKAQREREREARQREKEARERAQAAERQAEIKYPKIRRKVKWGKPVAITLFVLLIVGVGVLHVMPLPMEEYQQAASAALGRPVKIGSGRLSLYNGVRLNLENVTVGDAKIAVVHAYPEIGSLFDEKKAFKRIELQGVTIPQQAIGETLLTKTKGDNFTISRIFVKGLRLEGPVPLPSLEAEAVVGPDGALRTVILNGPEQLNARLTPAGSEIEFDVTAASVALPIAPEVTLNSFAMKGVANRQGMNVVGWGGSILDGALSGTANVRWTGNWVVEGVMTVRGINAAVFAPALLSEGKAEGTGRFQMSGVDPARLGGGARLDGSFSVIKGVLGSFDLSRAISTGGRQFAGRTQFTEMTGQGVYDRGAVTLRNVNITAGALNAAASADIAPGGAISGRIVADIRTSIQPLRATLIIGGTVRDPQVRN